MQGSGAGRPERVRSRAGELFLPAAWFALAAGLGEVAVRAAQQLVWHRVVNLSRDYVWMAPLANLLFFSVFALGLLLVARLLPRLPARRVATFVFGWFGFMNLLLLVPRLHPYAAIVLAAGLGATTGRVIAAHGDAFRTLARRSLIWMCGVTVALGVGVRGTRFVAERAALRGLSPATAGAPNVLLIILDTVRAASLNLYGYARQTTPELQRLARRGVVFERALATSPWTLPSHASIFTGRYPHELSADWVAPLDGTFPTLAEAFRDRGYRTAGFVANTGYCSYELGLDRGFVHYEDYRISLGQVASSSSLVREVVNNFRLRRLVRNDEHLNRQPATVISRAFLRWLDGRGRGDRPFFAFLNYYDAHGPYLPPAAFDRRFGPGRRQGKLSPLHRWNWDPTVGHRPLTSAALQEEIDAYDGALAYLDAELARLFAALEERGVLEQTVVVITADHGEEFGEHAVFDHGNSLYLASVHVPLVVLFPGRVPAGVTVRQPVTLRDLPATVAGLSGLEPAAPFPGASLARFWASDSARATAGSPLSWILSEVTRAPGNPAWFPVSKGDMQALVQGPRRYIRNGDGSEELYDFEHDRWERRNLVDTATARSVLPTFREAVGGFRRNRPAGR